MSDVKSRARAALSALVDESGGPAGTSRIKTGSLSVLKELFTERFIPGGQPHPDGVLVNVDGWHAFQELVPITDPNRWDRLRADVYRELEKDGWDRVNKPRGSQFLVPHRLLGDAPSTPPADDPSVVILTWNPEHWGSDEGWAEQVAQWPAVDQEWLRWSTGHRSTGIEPGDHAVLLRQGRERGIVGIGHFTTEVFQGPHWSGENKDANYAGVEWECLVPLENRIETEELIELIPEVPWNSLFASGVQAPPEGAGKVLELCRERFGGDDLRVGSDLPDPDEERGRLPGLESWAHYMLSSLLAGGRPPGQNRPHVPSDIGAETIRTIDEQCFDHGRPDEPALYWEFKLDGRPEDPCNGWPDIAFVWPDRVVLVELKTDAGSVRDGQLQWYVDLGAANHPDAQLDLLFITQDRGHSPPASMPLGSRFANLTWTDVAEVLDGLTDLVEPGDKAVIKRFLELLDELGILSTATVALSPSSETLVSPPQVTTEWIPEAVALAESTARDAQQRALDIEFDSWEQLDLAAGAVRDALESVPWAPKVQVWRWRQSTGGKAKTAAGQRTGLELRLSPQRT